MFYEPSDDPELNELTTVTALRADIDQRDNKRAFAMEVFCLCVEYAALCLDRFGWTARELAARRQQRSIKKG